MYVRTHRRMRQNSYFSIMKQKKKTYNKRKTKLFFFILKINVKANEDEIKSMNKTLPFQS